ncbi:hypothetical protein J6590_095327 [Homalodisca vitripennis]|nr:hypothetical protein J6590_095327 [Homalodisca vitripennis]
MTLHFYICNQHGHPAAIKLPLDPRLRERSHVEMAVYICILSLNVSVDCREGIFSFPHDCHPSLYPNNIRNIKLLSTLNYANSLSKAITRSVEWQTPTLLLGIRLAHETCVEHQHVYNLYAPINGNAVRCGASGQKQNENPVFQGQNTVKFNPSSLLFNLRDSLQEAVPSPILPILNILSFSMQRNVPSRHLLVLRAIWCSGSTLTRQVRDPVSSPGGASTFVIQ